MKGSCCINLSHFDLLLFFLINFLEITGCFCWLCGLIETQFFTQHFVIRPMGQNTIIRTVLGYNAVLALKHLSNFHNFLAVKSRRCFLRSFLQFVIYLSKAPTCIPSVEELHCLPRAIKNILQRSYNFTNSFYIKCTIVFVPYLNCINHCKIRNGILKG